MKRKQKLKPIEKQKSKNSEATFPKKDSKGYNFSEWFFGRSYLEKIIFEKSSDEMDETEKYIETLLLLLGLGIGIFIISLQVYGLYF